MQANTAEAAELGVFGAPTFIVGGERFWGQDRLPFVDRALAKASAESAAAAGSPAGGAWEHGSWAGEYECPERGQCIFTVPILSSWPGSNRGAGGGVSGTILAGLVDLAGVKAVQSVAR